MFREHGILFMILPMNLCFIEIEHICMYSVVILNEPFKVKKHHIVSISKYR